MVIESILEKFSHLLNETSLWQNYACGDNKALSELYLTYKPLLLSAAYKYVKCAKTSEDIVADTFEKLLIATPKKRSQIIDTLIQNPKAYLYLIVKNKCLDYIKKTNNRNSIISKLSAFMLTSKESDVFLTFTKDAFKIMLDQLQPREKEIITLHLMGFSNEEIAHKLGLSYHTVKNNIYESKLKLKKLWSHLME